MSIQTGQITQTRSGLGFGFCRRLVLSNADIIKLPSTVPVLVPAIEGRIIVPLWFSLVFDPWVADYTFTNPTMEVDFPTDADLFDFPHDVSAFLAPGSPGGMFLAQAVPWQDSDYFASLSDVQDQPLGLLTVNNAGTTDLGGGDPGNKIVITTFYITIP
jgi:hypothetical protein